MKSVCLFLFLLCVYNMNVLRSNASEFHQDELSAIIAWDGLRKITPWHVFGRGNNQTLSRHSPIAINRHLPLWTAGRKRLMSHSHLITDKSSLNYTHANNTLDQNSTLAHVTDLEEIRLIDTYKRSHLKRPEEIIKNIYNRTQISLQEMELLDEKWHLRLNSTK